MNRQDIMKILPHREDMLFLDEVENVDGVAHGKYYVRGDEFFLRGHFPNRPIVPGVILCEILAQSACILLQNKMSEGKTPMYIGLDKVKFRSPVTRGDTIQAECKIVKEKHPFYFAQGVVKVGNRLCAQAEFSFAITGE